MQSCLPHFPQQLEEEKCIPGRKNQGGGGGGQRWLGLSREGETKNIGSHPFVPTPTLLCGMAESPSIALYSSMMALRVLHLLWVAVFWSSVV